MEGPSPSGKREKTHLSPEKFGEVPFQAPHRWKRAPELPVLREEVEVSCGDLGVVRAP